MQVSVSLLAIFSAKCRSAQRTFSARIRVGNPEIYTDKGLRSFSHNEQCSPCHFDDTSSTRIEKQDKGISSVAVTRLDVVSSQLTLSLEGSVKPESETLPSVIVMINVLKSCLACGPVRMLGFIAYQLWHGWYVVEYSQ